MPSALPLRLGVAGTTVHAGPWLVRWAPMTGSARRISSWLNPAFIVRPMPTENAARSMSGPLTGISSRILGAHAPVVERPDAT